MPAPFRKLDGTSYPEATSVLGNNTVLLGQDGGVTTATLDLLATFFGSGGTPSTDISASTAIASGTLNPRTMQVRLLDEGHNVLDEVGCDNTGASPSDAAFAAAIEKSQTSGKWVYVPAGTYLLTTSLILLQYAKIRGEGSRSILHFDMTSSKYSCIITDAYKNSGSVMHLQIETNTAANKSNSLSVGIQIGSGKGTSPSINANLTLEIGYIYFGEGFYDQIYSNQECDNTWIHHCISFSNVGNSRMFFSIRASNREAPTACMMINQNHMTQPDCLPGDNKYGILWTGTDSIMLMQNIINNHDVNYYSNSPSNASMRENTCVTLINNYCEDQRQWMKDSPRWSAGLTLEVGDTIRPTKANANGLIPYVVSITTGVTGGSEPSWGGSGNDNFGEDTTVSTITDGGVTYEMRYASIGVMVSGESRRARIIGQITKGNIAAFVARGAPRLLIEGGDVVVLTPDHDVYLGNSGFNNSQGVVEIKDTNIRGNVRPWRTTSSDSNILKVRLTNSRIASGTDSTGLFPIDGFGTYDYGFSDNNSVRVITASGAITVTARDKVVVVNKGTGAASAVSLFSSPNTGATVTIKDGKGDAGSNNITITPAAGNIDGSGTLVLATNYESATLVYNGTQWNRIA